MTHLGDNAFCEWAVEEAAAELTAQGFTRVDSREWTRTFEDQQCGRLGLTVHLPEGFPHCLPSVIVDEATLPCSVPHVEVGGKLCLAPTTGILLDTANPRGIVGESLSRARTLISDGVSGRNKGDFIAEFSAYWEKGASCVADFIGSPSGPAREIATMGLHDAAAHMLIAEDAVTAIAWLKRFGKQGRVSREAFFVPLLPPLEMPCSRLCTRDARRMIQHSSSAETYKKLVSWIGRRLLPATVVLSLPLPKGIEYTVFALRFDRPRWNGTASQKALWEWMLAEDQPVTKIAINRMDPEYLMPRGGALASLQTKTVVVVGCGAVGSRVAEHLACSGIGHLHLVDAELLIEENAYRHPLGMAFLRCNKAKGMAQSLAKRFPHLDVQFRSTSIESVLGRDPQFVWQADLVVMATGDETLELRLNDIMHGRVPRVHAWVEPLGVGGHALAIVNPGPGCYRCLFTRDDRGLANRSSFARSGQTFQRTHSGCHGTFIPFGEIDADRTAIEAVRLALGMLVGHVRQNVLVSWFGDPSMFLAEEFKLSERASLFQPGDTRHQTDFAAGAACPACGK